MTSENVKSELEYYASELEYYLGYVPDDDLVLEALDWMDANPGINLSEWVDAMMEAGML